jgi:hypothetical protein
MYWPSADDKSKKSNQCYLLNEAKVTIQDFDKYKRSNVFILTLRGVARNYVLSAKSESEMKSWIGMMQAFRPQDAEKKWFNTRLSRLASVQSNDELTVNFGVTLHELGIARRLKEQKVLVMNEELLYHCPSRDSPTETNNCVLMTGTRFVVLNQGLVVDALGRLSICGARTRENILEVLTLGGKRVSVPTPSRHCAQFLSSAIAEFVAQRYFNSRKLSQSTRNRLDNSCSSRPDLRRELGVGIDAKETPLYLVPVECVKFPATEVLVADVSPISQISGHHALDRELVLTKYNQSPSQQWILRGDLLCHALDAASLTQDWTAFAAGPQLSRSETVAQIAQDVQLYEHQRFYPLGGWSYKTFPSDPPFWSTPSGVRLTKTTATPPVGYIWSGDWELDFSAPAGMFICLASKFRVFPDVAFYFFRR